eukprot:UC4_evm4s1075
MIAKILIVPDVVFLGSFRVCCVSFAGENVVFRNLPSRRPCLPKGNIGADGCIAIVVYEGAGIFAFSPV